MVVAWGARLAMYLFYRIMHIGRDARFDGIRERFWKFLKFWFFQGVAVWVIMLPSIVWFARTGAVDARGWTAWMTAGTAVWLGGLTIETIADIQKYQYKRRTGAQSRWMSSGLWRYSRHPNYFGELLCWWGLFLFVLPELGWWFFLGGLGPLAITGLLVFVTGIPTLERSADEKWGRDPEYQLYRTRTRRLVPWARKSAARS
jgi:steroid 5-alpha reductase family enzyme